MRLDCEILRLAIPMVVANITVPLLGIVDLAIVGHMGSPRYIAVVAVGAMMFNVMYWLMGFLRMGTSGLTAQAYGRQDGGEQAVLRRSMAMALGIAVGMVLLQRPLLWLAKMLFSVGEDIGWLVQTYFLTCIWGAPAVLGTYVMTGWFVGMQNTRVPMVVSIVQNVANILLSMLFVFVFGWGLRGVALGTLLAQWTGFVALTFFYCWQVEHPLRLLFRDRRGSESTRHEAPAPSIELPLFLRTACLVAVNLFFTSMGSRQGVMMLAVNTLLMTLFTLFSYVMDGFAFAGEALCGKYYGAGDRMMLHASVRRLMGWGGALALLFTLLYIAGGQRFLALLTDDMVVVMSAEPYRWWAVAVPLCGFVAFVYDGVFVGLTGARAMLLSTAVGAMAFFALYLSLASALGNHALWLSLLVYLALRGLVLAVAFRRSSY